MGGHATCQWIMFMTQTDDVTLSKDKLSNDKVSKKTF